MSFRVSVLVAATAVLGLSSINPASAQPQAPIRPRSSSFSSIFTPGLQQQQFQQQQFLNGGQGFGGIGGQGLLGPGVNPYGLTPGFGYPGQLAYQQALPGAYSSAALLPQSGIVGSFNNLGHWYGGQRGGNYGHWYPNGVASGRGILGYGGGGGGSYGGSAGMTGGPVTSGSALGSVGGTALGVGATLNQFRR